MLVHQRDGTQKGIMDYEIGDVFITINNINPSTRFGGTWELLCPGKTLVCVDTSDNDFKEVKQTGGEKTHTLSYYEMPIHGHDSGITWTDGQGEWVGAYVTGGSYNIPRRSGGQYHSRSYTDERGGSQAHNNLQPYMACYIWVKTA